MAGVLRSSWALLLGVALLMAGNGIQGTLLGVRGTLEGFSAFSMSLVMSGYFVGFLFGSRVAPLALSSVGHVRIFAALGSLISAVLVLYAVLPEVWAWVMLRVVMGFCFAGIFVTSESWLNGSATNETRGQAMSAYMIAQMIGLVGAQILMLTSEPVGYVIFILPSVLVSFAFLPILLSNTPQPRFEAIKPLGFKRLFGLSPLGCVGVFILGGIYSAMMGMASVWGMQAGLSTTQIAIFVGTMFLGGLVLQYPLGWLSDRMDRRKMILALALVGLVVMILAALLPMSFPLSVVIAFLLGAVVNPLFSQALAHANDHVAREEMAGASSGLLFLNGLGAVAGPVLTAWLMDVFGPRGFFIFLGILLGVLAFYTIWRMRRRASPQPLQGYTAISPAASAVAVEAVMESDRS